MTVNELIENFIPLAKKLAIQKKKTLPRKVELDDLVSAAYYGLVDAARRFDLSKNISFGTYAKFRILGEIQDFIRQSLQNHERFLELDEEICEEIQVKHDEFFEDVTRQLNAIDKNVVILYYVDDLSLKEIGRRYGLSESRVSQILKHSHKIVKRTMVA